MLIYTDCIILLEKSANFLVKFVLVSFLYKLAHFRIKLKRWPYNPDLRHVSSIKYVQVNILCANIPFDNGFQQGQSVSKDGT